MHHLRSQRCRQPADCAMWKTRCRANVLRFTNLDIALPFLQPHELPSEVRGSFGAPTALGPLRAIVTTALRWSACATLLHPAPPSEPSWRGSPNSDIISTCPGWVAQYTAATTCCSNWCAGALFISHRRWRRAISASSWHVEPAECNRSRCSSRGSRRSGGHHAGDRGPHSSGPHGRRRRATACSPAARCRPSSCLHHWRWQ